MQTQIVVLESVEGKFGRQLKDKSGFLSFGKFYKGNQEFPSGTVLDCELYVTEKGSRYINKAEVVSSTSTASEVPAKRGRKPKSHFESTVLLNQELDTAEQNVINKRKELNNHMVGVPLKTDKKEVNWDELGRGKTASLFWASLLQNPNMFQSIDQVIEMQDKTAEVVWELVDIVFRTRKEKV